MQDTTQPKPGDREPAMKKAIDETAQPVTPTSPIVDPGVPVGPNDGPNLTSGPGAGGSETKPPQK